LIAPSGDERTVPVVDGRAVATGSRAGFYTLRAGDQEDVFAANLGPSEEAVIAPAEHLELGGARAPRPAIGRAGVRTEIWMVLVLAVLGVVLVEWFTYHRRLTV
jgi:hypothetical protein